MRLLRRVSPVCMALFVVSLLATANAGSPATSREETGVAEYARRQLEATYPDASGPGAAILIARGDEALFRGARGVAKIGDATPLVASDVFGIGSITKQFVAAAILKLAQERRLSLDDPISTFIEDYPRGDKITLRQLLGHTSGVRSYTELEGVLAGPIKRDVPTQQVIASFKQESLNFEPGNGFAYTNSGYVLLGAVIEVVTGQPWHRYLEEALFRPSGMARTGYAGDPVVASRMVSGYSVDKGAIVPAGYISMTWAHAAAGIVSSLDDLLTWNRRLHRGQVLDADHYQQMITPSSVSRGGYGLGMSVERVRGQAAYGHSGFVNGYGACMLYMPGPAITVEILENSDGGGTGADPCVLARKLAEQALAGTQ
jgi:D-alanyl-D-alanine carboxypeptidase